MDAEINYESDISESWSLIDVNLNEESLNETDKPTLEKSCSPELKNVNLRKVDEIELQDFVTKCTECNFSHLSDSDSDSETSVEKHDTETCDKINEIHSLQSLEGDDDNDDNMKNDSGDAESIEILDLDGNYQDSEIDKLDVCGFEHFDFATYQSDDEESSDGRAHNESRSNFSTVIKRKRRRISRDAEDTLQCVYSEGKSSSNKSDTKEESHNLNTSTSHPVYKHYRNNVANTVLNLSVRVIFAGVACIAIGHFLGVQDAAETAVELVETLKKLQVENAALQSSMVHLKKALLTLEMSPKLELPFNQQPHSKVSCEETPKVNPSKMETPANLNNAALTEIRSSLNSIEWLSKFQNIAKKGTDTENTEIEIKGFEKHIHDQLNLLKERKKNGAKHSEDTELLLILKKLLLVLKKIMSRLSSSHDNIEVMHERLVKLKHVINHKLNKLLRDSLREERLENKVPVTELDLKTMRWSSNNRIQMNFEQESPESKVLCKFPQPQKYYEIEKDLKSINETNLEPRNLNSTLENNNYEIVQKIKNKKKYEKEKKEKKQGKKIFKKEKDKKGGKKRKRDKFFKLNENFEKHFEKKNRFIEPVRMKYFKNLQAFNESDISNKKKEEKDVKYKRRVKKVKKSKLKKILFSKIKKESELKKNKYVPFCSESQCFNLTGLWVFKWADGRKEYRRYQTLGDWQFDRAKARKDVRDFELNNNWQFERAKARKELRNEDFSENWQFKRALARESNRNDDKSQRKKFTKFSGKEFFQEKFSWI